MTATCSLIVAQAANGVIGNKGTIPWHLPADLKRFQSLTTGHPVIMGRKTYTSILDRLGRPLPGRDSIVVSRCLPYGVMDASADYRVAVVNSCDQAVELAERVWAGIYGEYFVAGGAEIYRQMLPRADQVYLTHLHKDFEGDARMPDGWEQQFTVEEDSHFEIGFGSSRVAFSFVTMVRA